MGMLEKEMKNLARQAGGSHKTVHDRIAMAERFCKRLMELNIQIRYVRHLKSRHIEDYIQLRLAQGIQKQTLHNETAAIRKILAQAGRDKLAQSERISNKSLGLAGATRNHTRRAITPERYQQVLGGRPAERCGAGGGAGTGKADGAALAGSGTVLPVIAHLAGNTGAG